MKTIEVPDHIFEELEQIAEYYNSKSPGRFEDAGSAIPALMGALAVHNKEIYKIVYPPEDHCQICGNLICTGKERAQRACNECFAREMKDIDLH